MKKYKQILAGLLAMNLAVYVMPTGMVQISASVQNQNNENTDTEKIEANTAEPAGTTEEGFSESTQPAEADTTESAQPDATDTSDDSSSDADSDDSENSTGDQTSDSISDTTTELPGDTTGDAATATATPTVSPSTEDTFSDGTQPDASVAAAEDNTAEQTTGNKLALSNFVHYKNGIIDIESVKELILLSNCDPEEIQNLTINLKLSGAPAITSDVKIAATEDISSFYNDTAITSAEEDQQSDIVNTENTQSDSRDNQTEEINQDSEEDTADTTEDQDETQESDIPDETNQSAEEIMQETASDVPEETSDDNTASQTKVVAGQEYTFQGIGTADVPFQGTITGQAVPVSIDRAFFGGLSSKARFNLTGNADLSLYWCGDGIKPMIADVYQFDSTSENGHSIPVTVKKGTGITSMGSLFGTVQEADGVENQTLILTTAPEYDGTETKISSADNAGLICNTLKSGNICLDGYKLPANKYTVESTGTYDPADTTSTTLSGNAGGLIGLMGKNTTLEMKSQITVPNGSTVTASRGNAGGLAGLMQQGAKIKTENNATVTLDTMTVEGNISAGGVVGTAEDVTFADEDIISDITVKSATVTESEGTSAGNIGGFIGKYTLNASNLGEITDVKLPEHVKIESPVLTVSNENGLAGGYFGYLDLKGKLTYTVGGEDDAKTIINPTYKKCKARAIGAVAGKVTSTDIAGTLLIQNMKIKATMNTNNGINYHGGLIGELGTISDQTKAVYLKVSDSDINVITPQVSENDKNGFGGIAGTLAQGSILKTEDTVKIVTPDAKGTACATEINQGGGLVGYAEKSMIDLSGTTDLSGAGYKSGYGKNAKTGWLVGKQESALIYAEGDGNGNGWKYIRGKEKTSGKTAMNDIGNYGQIIRLHSKAGTSGSEQSKLASDLISIDENHSVQYGSGTEVSISGNVITVGSENSFARLSIAWNTRGNFGGVEGITASDFSTGNPGLKNITLTADIDLTGSGITGLSRDTSSSEDIYKKGTFDGNGKKITLSIGETFGYKASGELAVTGEDGQGEVISAGEDKHGRQGLFAKVAGATIRNLTIAGNINISNGGGADILVGGIAGELAEASECKISGVTVEETITADCANNANNAGVMAGGFFGGVYNNGAALTLGTSGDESTLNTAAAKISLKNFANKTVETRINAGGVIGEVGESGFTFSANCLRVQGSITTEAKKKAYVGGLIGVIKGDYDKKNVASPNHKIEIKDVTFDGFKISADTAADMCGGLFGSIWANVNLYFSGNTQEKPGLNVTSATIQAQNAASVGGLAYRSSGRWEIQDYGIKMDQLSINAKKDVGLLVCRGESNNDTIANVNKAIGALYLSTTKYWDTSYQITSNVLISTTDTGAFDEFVAYTTPSAAEISDNDKNGVISIATQDDGNGGRVGVDVSSCTTYQNRTAYGKNHQTNACSRYYYDLDQCLTDMVIGGTANSFNSSRYIDTPQELMLWSVRYYACKNIKEFFEKTNGQTVPDVTTKQTNRPWFIGAENVKKNVELNMQKYSYYPIKYTDSSINVWFANIKFCNMEIEQCEQNQKSTQGTSENHTQHYTMHCGLLLNYQPTPGNLNVTRVTFSGSIGKVNKSTSGALIANIANGSPTSKRVTTITINSLTFDNLKVNNCGDGYAPLLINSITNDVTLNANKITTKINGKDTYTGGTAVASSLIGTTGTKTAKRLNMTFQNIVLPDKKAEGITGIFSHATLLESFSYDENDNTSGASYNFYKADDWSDTTHKHEVTYGREITETTEYPNFQKWYYDEDTYGNAAGLVYDNSTDKSFSATAYLKYVCEGYNKKECKHEIRVNQRVTNIIHGCGTYGHPYQITTEKEMEILSEYMATGTARKDWRVTITRNQSEYHQTASADKCDATYQFDGNYWQLVENKGTNGKDDWKVVDGANKLTNEFMLQYLLNAYYDIQGAVPSDSDKSSVQGHQLNLTDFGGFGSVSNPFRGVLTSSTGATIVLSGEQTGNGLIPYSYGSVVRKLKIFYRKSGKTLTYNTKTDRKYYPKQTECFGGVIGCVLGGDNIIEGVSVSMEDGWLTLSGGKSHLIQVGGYVGTVSGGGVIFRNMTDETGLTDSKITNDTNINPETETTYSDLYINPYVGRVMDGFAFYEKTSSDSTVVPKINNTDKNYKINTLDTSDTDCITISGDDVNVDNAQGLLILSAIINSGAASGGNSVSYSSVSNEKNETTAVGSDKKTYTYNFAGAYGKVRNASYDKIGEETEEGEVTLSKTDDQTVPGADSLPYLIKKYCKTGNDTEKAFKISVNSDVEINLSSNGTFDMSGYGNGYQGIGARYVSNAVRCDANGDKILTCKPEGIVPELKGFNGNNSTVILNMQVREYADDDFHAASVGGMFNILRVKEEGTISNLTIGQSSNTPEDVSLKYYNANGEESDVSGWDNYKENVGVGGFAGSVTGYTDKYEGDGAARDFTFNNIQLNNLKITSSANAGGIIGNSGRVSPNNRKDKKSYIPTDIAVLLQPKNGQYTYGIAFNNCNYTDLTVTGKYTSGGFAGCIANAGTNPRSSVNAYGLVGKVTNEILGKSSTISATDKSSSAGGLFGYVETRMFINMTDEGSKITDNKAVLNDVKVSAGNSAGGCIGYINEKCYGIHNVTVKATTAEASQIYVTEKPEGTLYAGGIIGYAKGAKQTWTENWTYAGGISESSIENVKINDVDKANGNYSDLYGGIKTNYIAGGIVGQTAGGETRIEKCTVKDSKIYGSVAGGINGQTDSEMQFLNCKVKGSSTNTKTKMNGFSTAGGILGFWTGGQAVTIQNCELQYLDIEGKDWGVGAMIGDAAEKGAGTLYLFNCSAQDSEVKAVGNDNEAGGRWPCVGGIIGNLRNTIKASNLLFSGVTLSGSDGSISKVAQGLLFGNAYSNVNIAGISIQNIPETNEKWKLAGRGTVTANNSYIAFADYSGTAVSDSANGKAADLLDVDTVVDPYVVTSPKNSDLKLYESEDATAKYIYGDGATWTSSDNNSSSFAVKAQEIWSHKDKVTDGHYAYSNISVSSFDASSVLSTYDANQTVQAKTNFPVVQIGANNSDAVKDYLDIITNGGFSAANSANTAKDVHVTAKTAVYEYKDGKFVKTEEEKAFKVNTDNKKQITFSTTTEYDNGNDRFTLLKVTFTEEGHNYNVFVPVLVRRMLEMDFTATLTYGTDFRKEDYNERTSHVLESFGSSITGYLTYTYNSAEDVYTDYGWESYINAGGNVMDMKKSIKFQMGNVNALPAGMQLTLVDAASGKAYYYTATGKEKFEAGGFNIPLGSFVDSSGKAYQEPSISELVGASASTTRDNKIFIKVDETGKPVGSDDSTEDKTYPEPTVRIKNAATGEYEYYRRADSSLEETGEYTIAVDESALKKGTSGKESSTVTENYYLVITVPEESNSLLLNGSVQTTVESKIPHQIHYRKIKETSNTGKTDDHVNTPSTYVLSSGYTQTLKESGDRGVNQKLSMSDSMLKVDVTNAITFPGEQIYNSNDNLYVRIVGGLQKTMESSNASGQATSAEQFPSGTTGTAEFYVYTENNGQKTYYTYQNNAWTPVENNKEQSAVNYIWTSVGGNMELPLSTDGKNENAISLQSLRDSLTGNKDRTSIFYVQVKMDATIPGAGLDVIPETELQSDDTTPKDYIKLTYYSQLSTERQSLTYSSNRATVPQTTTAYYREELSGVKLTYDADKIDQLGINLLDLQSAYLDADEQNSYIDTTATYDMSVMKNLKETLKKSSGIKFTLSLMPKRIKSSAVSGDLNSGITWKEDYGDMLKDASQYLDVDLKPQNSEKINYDNGTWSWTVPKASYYDATSDQITTSSVFDGGKLLQAIRLKVNVTNVENLNHVYSNYKVVLTADIMQDENTPISGTHKDDNIIYTLAKIKPEFVGQ